MSFRTAAGRTLPLALALAARGGGRSLAPQAPAAPAVPAPESVLGFVAGRGPQARRLAPGARRTCGRSTPPPPA